MWRVLLLVLVAFPAFAVETPRARVTLVPEVVSVAPGEGFRVALRQVLAPGWHTYWTNPGDAGQPPELVVNGVAAPLVFPTPQRIPYGPLVNFGYEGEAIFLATVTPPRDVAGDFRVIAEATWLVCREVCIPEEGRFELTLPVEAAPRLDAGAAALFTRAEASAPREAPFTARAGFAGRAGAIEIEGPGIAPGMVREAFFFPIEGGILDNTAPQPLSVVPGSLVLGLTRAGSEAPPARLEGVLALTDGGGQRSAYRVAASIGAVPQAGGIGLAKAALLALLGGLILNLMPCVFPVLAMKALALVRLGGAARGPVRAHALSTAAGVVLSFTALGAALVGLRAAGSAAGWGFQFTAPGFVAAMAWLMLAVGLNLAGVFRVGGPVGVGAGLAARGGHGGAFATGVLAVLVATPCTAPFMAAAIGAALAMPPAAALAIFVALGLGMALPYLLLALAPGLTRALPRPGAWMERLRQALAWPMFATAAWLVWVLSAQAGPLGVAVGLGGAVLVGFGAWMLGLAQEQRWRLGRPLAGVAVLVAFALLPVVSMAPPAAAGTGGEPWSPARVAALQAEGRPVFVNMTAAWCITCKVNERVALQSAGVRHAFAERGVAELVGDWTRGDAAIGDFLRSMGREGVPLYLVYPAGGGAPRLLPEILTEAIVLRSLE